MQLYNASFIMQVCYLKESFQVPTVQAKHTNSFWLSLKSDAFKDAHHFGQSPFV